MIYVLNLNNFNIPQKVKKIKIENKKILVVSPHSDDLSISCGATINFLSQKNEIIPVLFFKQSEKREKEMKKEANVLNTKNPFFLSLKSNHFPENLTKDIAKAKNFFQKSNPDIVFLPQKNDFHPSHKLATEITLKSLPNRSSKLFFYETPWSLFNNFQFNTASFFSKKRLKRKIKAIKKHQSQIKNTAFDKIAESLAIFRGNTIPEQRIFGYGKKNYLKNCLTEAFFYENNN